MNLSPHFTLDELTSSESATRKGIDNKPSEEVISNLKLLCLKVLEPIRGLLDKPISISSGYRSKELNTLIGGSKSSQHIEGKAADFKVKGMSIEEIFKFIIDTNLEYDQVIQEFDQWIHISYNDKNNRKQKLRATKDKNNKTIYTEI